MACRLSEDQISSLFGVVHGAVIASKNRGDSFNALQAIRDLYKTLIDAGAEQANAMDYIQHVPSMLLLSHAMFEDSKVHMRKSAVNLSELDQLDVDFNADIQNVAKFLQPASATNEAAAEIIEESNPSTGVIPTDVYTEIENMDAQKKKEIINSEISFVAAPDTALAVFNQEAKAYGGVEADQNIPDPDPVKRAYYAVVRRLNNLMSQYNRPTADKLTLGNVTGIYLRLVPASMIGLEQLQEADKQYYSTDDPAGKPFAKTAQQKMEQRDKGDETYLVFSDKQGNILYFDQEGTPVEKDKGVVAYGKMRRPYTPSNSNEAKGQVAGQRMVGRVQTVADLVSKGLGTVEELSEERDEQMNVLEKSRQFVVSNPNQVLLFSVTPGKNGYVKEDFSKANPISSIELPEGFKPWVSNQETGIIIRGGVYFSVPGYEFPLLIRRPKFQNIPSLVQNLADMIFNAEVSNIDKIKTLKQFTFSNDTNIYEKDGKLMIKQGGENFEVKAENKDKFITNLNTQTVNINKDLVGTTFNMPVNLDGKVTLQPERYNNFLADNFYTNLAKNEEGKIVSLNAYNVIFPTTDTQNKIFGEVKVQPKEKTSSLEQSTPTDNTVDEFKALLDRTDFSLKKSLLLDSTATKEQIDAAEKWYNNSPLSKIVPFQVMFNVVNSNALAEFTVSGITLWSGSNFTDLYHEGWHAFSQMFLTKEQKKALYNEARKLTGSFKTADGRTVKFSAAADMQLEEFMAEDFRKYILSDRKNIINGRPVRNTTFRKIWNFLKQLFSRYSLKDIAADRTAVKGIQELYDKLYVGDINDYTPSIRNVQFGILNKGMEAVNPGVDESLNYQDSMTMVETIDSLIASTISGYGYSVGSIFTNPELMGPLYQQVKKKLEQMKEGLADKPSPSNIIDFALSNWGDFSKVAKGEQSTGVIAFHKKRSSYFTFEDKMADMDAYDESLNEQAAEVKDTENPLAKTEQQMREEYGQNAFERKGNELSVRELASNEIVYLIKSLPQVDKKGKPILNVLGVPKLVDFNKTWGLIINTVAGSNTTNQMYGKLLDASTRFPELKALVDRTRNPLDHTKTKNWPYMKIWINFFRDFSVYRIPIKEGRLIFDANGGFRFEFSEVDPQFRQVERTFSSQFQALPGGRYVTKSPAGNQLNTVQVIKDFSYYDIFNNKKAIIDEDKAIQFLRAIGFYITDNNAIREQITNNYGAVGYLYKAVEWMAERNETPANPINALRKAGSKGGETTSVNKILIIEAQDSGKYSNNAVTNVNGDIIYDLSLNNTITKLLNDLNNPELIYSVEKNDKNNPTKKSGVVQHPHLQHLDFRRNPGAKYSIMLNSMFSIPSGNLVDLANINKRIAQDTKFGGGFVTMDIVNLDGIKTVIDSVKTGQSVQSGIKTTNLDPVSKFLFDVHTMLKDGVMELPRHASKSSAYGLRVSRIDSPFNTDKTRHLYISPGYFDQESEWLPKSVDLLLPKIAAEMERMAIIKQGQVPNIPGFNQRGQEFIMFDDILIDATKDKLKTLANAEDSLSVIQAADIKKEITNDIKDYLNRLMKENMDIFQKMPFISPELLSGSRDKSDMASYIRTDLKKAVGEDQTDRLKEVAIKAFTVNALVHNMEVNSVIYGDPASYDHTKEDYNKRNASVGSTGRIFASDEAVNLFIDDLGRGYARSIGANERSFDGIIRTAVFKDNKVKSVYYKEYLEALTAKYGGDKAKKILEPYESMTEGDGQGWITFDAYRILSIVEGAWSEKQNNLYNRIIDGEQVDPSDITEFFPTKKFQYAGPVKTEKLHVQGFHKFSLVPLIPSLVKGTNMEVFHDNLVKQGVDYALFESGSKLATITSNGKPDSLYENDDYNNRVIKPWNEGEPTYTPNDIFIQYLKDQVDIQSTWKNKTVFSTQLRKLIINDTFKQGLALTGDFDKLVKDFEGLLEEMQEYKKQELLKQVGWKENASGELTGSMRSLLEFVAREMERLELPEHEIDFVRESLESGSFTDLSFSLNAEKIEKMLNNIVVKRLVKQKMNGEMLVQVSGAGFESRNRYTNPSEEEIKKYRGTNDLPTYRPGKIDKNGKRGKTTAMKVKISLKGDYYKLLNLKHNDGQKIGTRERLNDMIKNDQWLDKGDNRKMITMVGVRIPVQGLNSMEFMEVYEFLPEEAGSIIVPPAEIVAKSGADFDIDKLTIFQPNIGIKINRDKSKGKIKELSIKYPDLDFSMDNINIILDAAENDFSVYELNEDEQKVYKVLLQEATDELPTYIKGKGLKSSENKVVEKIREILEHPDNFDALIRPNDTNLVKGVADDLANENIQGYDPFAVKSGNPRTITKNGKTIKVISPTRILEPAYNMYKHESNNVGKKTLGIGAVDNAFSSIFKRVGARLEQQYTHYFKQENGDIDFNKKPQVRPINIRMAHNKFTENGKEFISLSDINTVTNDKISDLIGQLMNGWVDIEKDAWIFNINGNNIAGPVLLFMLEAGVDFKTAAYFVSQPLVVDYIKEMYKVESPFYNAANPNNQADPGKGLRRFNIKKGFYTRLGMGPLSKQGNLSNELLYDTIEKYNKDRTYDVKSLEKVIKSKDRNSPEAIAGLLHFMELEEVTKQLTNIKLTVNVDTAPSKSLYAASERLDKIEGLEYVDAVPGNIIDKILTDSPISSFLIQKFQLAILKPLMQLRGDAEINSFLLGKIKARSFATAFPTAEKFVAAFHNDLPMYLLQNYIKGIDLGSIKEYKGLSVQKAITVKNVQLRQGAFVKDGVMYIDMNQMESDFRSKAFAGKEYENQGLAKVNSETFNMGSNEQNLQEYTHFVMEREYLRSITPVGNQSREVYEQKLATRALELSFNFFHMLKAPGESVADRFLRFKNELSNEYTLFDQIGYVNKGAKTDESGTVQANNQKLKTLKLTSSRTDKDLANVLHENLVRLADPMTAKVDNPVKNSDISRFFNRMIVAEYLRAGSTKSSDNLASILPTKTLLTLMAEPIHQLSSMKDKSELLNQYYSQFIKIWNSENSATRQRFRNYLKTTNQVKNVSPLDIIEGNAPLQKNQQGLFVYPAMSGSETAKKIIKNHSNTMLVYPNAKDGKGVLALVEKADNGIIYPVTLDGKKPFTDETFEENAKMINDAITAIETQYENGNEVAFPEQGLTMVNGKDMLAAAPRTKSYMALELYKRLNYVMPGSEADKALRKEMQSNQDITDEMVDEFMRKCFGE
jgi:hypothetical protein